MFFSSKKKKKIKIPTSKYDGYTRMLQTNAPKKPYIVDGRNRKPYSNTNYNGYLLIFLLETIQYREIT